MKTPPSARIRWNKAYRIISTRHPPIALFEDIADPKDWDLIMEEETKTNPRYAASIGDISLVPESRRVSGNGASYVMAPFTHISRHWPGRFHDGRFGAYYAANRFETAVAETSYHRAKMYRDTNEPAGWFSQLRELVGTVAHDFHDIRRHKGFKGCLNPNDYKPSQTLARALRSNGSDGIVYPSVRDPKGQCIAAFWPDVIGVPVQARALAYHFDGVHIDLIRDEASKDVFRIV